MFEADALGLVILIVFLLCLIVIAVSTAILSSTVKRFLFPEGRLPVDRACPHCYRQMPPRALVCAFCNRESEPWTFQDGFWWRTNAAGKREYLDVQTRRWVEHTGEA